MLHVLGYVSSCWQGCVIACPPCVLSGVVVFGTAILRVMPFCFITMEGATGHTGTTGLATGAIFLW